MGYNFRVCSYKSVTKKKIGIGPDSKFWITVARTTHLVYYCCLVRYVTPENKKWKFQACEKEKKRVNLLKFLYFSLVIIIFFFYDEFLKQTDLLYTYVNAVWPVAFQNLIAKVFHHLFGHFLENFAPHGLIRLETGFVVDLRTVRQWTYEWYMH